MCVECWKEAGEPLIINEKTKDAAKLINDLQDFEGCGAGGYAHIVVDDWNISNDDIDFCLKEANEGGYDISEDGRQACIDTLLALRNLTEDERYSALYLSDKMAMIA